LILYSVLSQVIRELDQQGELFHILVGQNRRASHAPHQTPSDMEILSLRSDLTI